MADTVEKQPLENKTIEVRNTRVKRYKFGWVLLFLAAISALIFALSQKTRADYASRRWYNLQKQRDADSMHILKQDSMIAFLVATSPLNGKGCWKVKRYPDSTAEMLFVPDDSLSGK